MPTRSHSEFISALSRPVSRRARSGFTLIEIMMAAFIFGILGMIILSTFRTGTRAYEEAQRQAVSIDQARFALDALSRDIRSTVVLSEALYNKAIGEKLASLQKLIDEARWTGDWSKVEQATGSGMDHEELNEARQKNPEGFIGNIGEDYVLVDLALFGESKEGMGTLSFVAYKPVQPDRPGGEWGVTRITYEAREGILVRSETSVIEPPQDILSGEMLVEPPPAEREIMAQGVVRFELRFGYWFDEAWIESDSWDSTGRFYRNAFNLIEPLGDPEMEERRNTPGTPEYQHYHNMLNNAPEDLAPAYVRVFLELADLKSPKRTKSYTTLIRYPQSQETYIPNDTIDDIQKDLELERRRGGDSNSATGGMR